MRPQEVAYRARRAVRRRGVGGATAALYSLALQRVHLNECHVWYLLDLTARRPQVRPLRAGLVLRRAEVRDLPLLERMQTVSAVGAEHRLMAGNDLWMVLEQGQLLFCCTTYRQRTPVAAAPGGWLRLPSATVCLEASETAQAGRGQGIAPAAWSTIAAGLAADGTRRMITKVAVENTSSRRAVEKVGFQGVALMRYARRGPLQRTRLEVLDDSGAFLHELFNRV